MKLFIISGILVLGCGSQLFAANLVVHATDANQFSIIQNTNTVFTLKSDQDVSKDLFQNSSHRKNTKHSAIRFSNIQIDEKLVTDSATDSRSSFPDALLKTKIPKPIIETEPVEQNSNSAKNNSPICNGILHDDQSAPWAFVCLKRNDPSLTESGNQILTEFSDVAEIVKGTVVADNAETRRSEIMAFLRDAGLDEVYLDAQEQSCVRCDDYVVLRSTPFK